MTEAELKYWAGEVEKLPKGVSVLIISRHAPRTEPPTFIPGAGWVVHPLVAYALGLTEEREP